MKQWERDYYDKAFAQNKHNLKKAWKLIKNIIGKNTKKDVQHSFNIDGKLTSEKKVIANKFNQYFVNIGPTLERNIPASEVDYMSFLKGRNPHSIFIKNTDEDEIYNIVQNLKSQSSGWDGISCSIVKRTLQYIIKPLVYIFNTSLNEGHVPKELKIARVVPIHKSKDKSHLQNYRPISILPIFSKIIERIMYNRLSDFINKHDLLCDSQFGFRQNYGTNLACAYLINKIHIDHENNDTVLGLFLDLSKAFDTINHTILLNNLNAYGIRGVAALWIESYLTEGYQYVSQNDEDSDSKEIKCGVLQGSILGSLLFLLYINDLTNVCRKEQSFYCCDAFSAYNHNCES